MRTLAKSTRIVGRVAIPLATIVAYYVAATAVLSWAIAH